MIRRLLRLLGSLRLTLVIIIALAALLLAGLVIPQRGVLTQELFQQWQGAHPGLVATLDRLGLTDVYTSPLAYGLWALFFLNLAVVMSARIAAVRARIALHPGKLKPPAADSGQPRHEIRLPQGCHEEHVPQLLAGRRARVLRGRTGFYAVRNRLSPVATIVFHLSFFLLLIGGLTSIYSRFTARVELAEGEVFTGEPSQYLEPPHLPRIGDPPRPRFTVERIEPETERGTPVGITVTVRDRTGAAHTGRINRPFRIEGCSFVIQDLGVAPLLIITDRNGRELDGAWVKLDVLLAKQDRFTIAGLDLDAGFFPDLVIEDGVPATRSHEMRNPALVLTAVTESGERAEQGLLRLGDRTEISGVELTFAEIRYWVRFYVRRESGLAVIWTGFAMAAAALVWRFVFYRREYWGTFIHDAGGTTLVLTGRAEHYRDLFTEELAATAEELRDRLSQNRQQPR